MPWDAPKRENQEETKVVTAAAETAETAEQIIEGSEQVNHESNAEEWETPYVIINGEKYEGAFIDGMWYEPLEIYGGAIPDEFLENPEEQYDEPTPEPEPEETPDEIIEPETSEELQIEEQVAQEEQTAEIAVRGPDEVHLTARGGVFWYGDQKETWYNLPMDGVISIMTAYGWSYDDYWIREDGCKMLGPYIMVAANLDVHPRGTLVETSLGTGLVCDTGGFAQNNPLQVDIAVNW